MARIVVILLLVGVAAGSVRADGDAEAPGRRDARFGMKALRSYRPNDDGRPTVCLVHGMNSSSGGFVHMVPLLERAGYGVVVYDYPFNRDLDASAPRFVSDWKEFRQRVGDVQPWALVTHSMGALLARFYVEGRDYAGDVDRLILIGPPNAGSAIARAQPLFELIETIQATRTGEGQARVAPVGAAAEDLLPGSRFLERLAGLPRREGVAYHILAGDVGFLDRDARRRVEDRFRAAGRGAGVLGGLARIAGAGLLAGLDELTDGTGDGAVAVASTLLEGVADHVVIPANHVELIRGPMMYPDPGPVACMPHVLKWLATHDADDPGAPRDAGGGSQGGDF